MWKRLSMKSWFSARQSEFKPVLQQKKKKKTPPIVTNVINLMQ